MASPKLEDKMLLGIFLMLVANLCFSGIDSTTKWLIGLGFPATQLAFLRYAGHFTISLGIAIPHRLSCVAVPRDLVLLVVVRGSILALSTLGNFVALTYLHLTVTSAIMFSAPLIVCILSNSMLGERVSLWQWQAVVIGFLGVIIVMRPFGEDFHPAMLLSLLNAICMAMYSILTRQLAPRVTTETMQFYSGLSGTLLLCPFAYTSWQGADDWYVLSLWALLGFCGWLGHYLLTRAHLFAAANILMPYSYSFLIYLIVLSCIIFNHVPDFWTILGALIITISGLLIMRR